MKACMSEEKIFQFSSFNWSRSADVIILKLDVLPLNIPFFYCSKFLIWMQIENFP